MNSTWYCYVALLEVQRAREQAGTHTGMERKGLVGAVCGVVSAKVALTMPPLVVSILRNGDGLCATDASLTKSCSYPGSGQGYGHWRKETQ